MKTTNCNFKISLRSGLFVFFLNISFTLFSQNIAINTSGNTPYTGAILDLSNQNTIGTNGFLPPYVSLTNATTLLPLSGTQAQLSGLLVYNTNTSVANGLSGPGLYYWNNTLGTWVYWSSGSSGYIDNQTVTQTTANFNIQSAAAASVGGVIEGAVGQTADLLDLNNSTPSVLTSFNNLGYLGIGVSPIVPLEVSYSNAGSFLGEVINSSTTGSGLFGVNSAVAGAGSGTGIGGLTNQTGGAAIAGNLGGGLLLNYYTNTGISGVYTGNVSGGTATLGINTYNGGGSSNYGILGEAIGAGANVNVGSYGSASGATYNAAFYEPTVGGESVINNPAAQSAAPTRSWNGSIVAGWNGIAVTSGRISWVAGGYRWYVNSTGSADYSEYFYATDTTLGVGEIVAIDPEHASGVRRARPSDAASTVGIISFGGTRLNDNNTGNRQNDPNSVNVGMVGQVPVLVSTENGDIKPGDALTISNHLRGRAVKAIGPCRIIGYAITHFPYVNGEKDYETDIAGGTLERLPADHVMCYLNVGWYQPLEVPAGDGVDPPTIESASAMNARITATIVPPYKEACDKNAAAIKATETSRKEVSIPVNQGTGNK